MDSNPRAIDFDEHVNRNREILAALPPDRRSALTWNPAKLRYDVDKTALDLFYELFLS